MTLELNALAMTAHAEEAEKSRFLDVSSVPVADSWTLLTHSQAPARIALSIALESSSVLPGHCWGFVASSEKAARRVSSNYTEDIPSGNLA